MFPHDPEPEVFPLYEYTIQPETVQSITWSPSNDLCVLVYIDNTIALSRAGITHIWTFSKLTSTVTCIAWHPNGQEFVFGCQDGKVYQMNTAHTTLDPVSCWPPFNFEQTTVFGVSSLVWINYAPDQPGPIVPGFDPNAFDMEEYLPNLSMEPIEEPIPALAFQKIQKRPLPEQSKCFNKTQTLLLIGDQNGSLHLSLNAGYHIGTIPCSFLSSKGSIVSIELSQDFTRAQVLVEHAGIGSYNLVTLDTEVLQNKKQHLCNVADIEHEIDYLLRYIQHCTKIMESHHTAYTNLAKNNANKISNILNYENDDTIPLPHVELLGLLATGNLNPAIHEYLSAGLTPNHAKQWETKAMHSYTSIQRIVIEYLQPACERLLLQLGKLRGYGLWTKRYGDLLCLDNITTAIELAQQYMWTAQELLKSVGQVSKRFQEFISWICRVVQKLIDQSQRDYQDTTPGPLYQNPNLVMNYLMKDFVKDSLEEYFAEPMDDRSDMTLRLYTDFDDKPMKRNQSMTCKPLPPTLLQLIKQCKTILDKPADLMSHFIKHVDMVRLDLSEHGNTVANQTCQNSTSSYSKEDKGTLHHYYAFIKRDPGKSQQVYLVHTYWNKTTHQDAMDLSSPSPRRWIDKAYTAIDMGPHWFVTDVEFLDEKELALLLQYQDDDDSAVEDEKDMSSGSYLATIHYDDLSYRSLEGTTLSHVSISDPMALADSIARYMYLPDMKNVIMGSNGREKRRIMAVAASSSLFRVLELDPADDDDDDDDDAMEDDL